MIEDQEHIARRDQRARRRSLFQPAQADEELVEDRGSPPVRQLARHASKQLACGRTMREPPGIAAGVDDEDAFRVSTFNVPTFQRSNM